MKSIPPIKFIRLNLIYQFITIKYLKYTKYNTPSINLPPKFNSGVIKMARKNSVLASQ